MRLESASSGCVAAAAHAQQCIDYKADILRVIESTLLVGHFLVQAPGMKTLVGNGLWHGPLKQLQPVVKLDASSWGKETDFTRISNTKPPLLVFMLPEWRLVEARTLM